MSLRDEWLTALCRDCGWTASVAARKSARCIDCGSPRLLAHRELDQLNIAHLDCDAFYAAVEKRDNPELLSKAVIVGGGRRGVVTSACYIARMYGVRSAMPMFKALAACPDAVVIRPDMAKYAATGRAIRSILEGATPLVEPLSIDEAFLDLTGTERLHGACAASVCARLVRDIHARTGISVSVGLSHNKLLAKMASGMDKPRGFTIIGRAETRDFLEKLSVSALWGVGPSLSRKLQADGLRTVGDLRRLSLADLVRRYGTMGGRLAAFAVGEDDRPVTPGRKTKSVSAETTFDQTISDPDQLPNLLWPLCERVAARLAASGLAGQTAVLRLKTDRFRTLTRNRRLSSPTALAGRLFDAGRSMLRETANGGAWRLIGIGVTDLRPGDEADPPDLADPGLQKRRSVELAMTQIRGKMGAGAIVTGRSLPGPKSAG